MEPLTPSDPARIASYELLARLGAGGMGLVYLARSPGGRLVAVKVIHTHLTDAPGFLRRFRREVEAARSVSGFYTAPVIDADTESRPAWLATAHVAGPALGAVVRDRGPLPPRTVTALAAALAEALKAVHTAGLIHRDLKPSNILLAEDGPRVIDFGIVHAADGTETTGGLVGTPSYMSPEQTRGGDIGPETDVFSLGGVLYFASTGSPPFGSGELPAVLHRVLTQEPDLARVPAEQRDLIRRCLAKEPSMRPTPDEILAELAGSIADGPVDWTEGPQSSLIDEYATLVSSYADPAPEPGPRPVPQPDPEPETEPRTRRKPEPKWGSIPSRRAELFTPIESVPRPRPEPEASTPRPRPPEAAPPTSTGSRRRGWGAVLALLALAGVIIYVVLDPGGSSREDGFRPWSVDGAFRAAVVADGVAYIGKKDGTAAHDAKTGRRRWESKAGEKEMVAGRAGSVLIVWSETRLSALDSRSGKRLWQIPTNGEGCTTRPGALGRVMLMDEVERQGSPDQMRVSAVEPATGARVWSKTLDADSCTSDVRVTGEGIAVVTSGKNDKENVLVSLTSASGESWRATTEEVRTFAAAGSNVYTATKAKSGYRIRAYAADTGRRRWDVPLAATSSADPEMVVEGSTLYVLEDETLYALQASDGRRLWKSSLPEDISGRLSVAGGTAYVEWEDNGSNWFRTVERTSLAAFDLATGRRLWQKRINSDADVAAAEGRLVYVASYRKRSFRPDEKTLIAFDTRTGRQRWKRDATVKAPIVIAAGILYVLNGDTMEAIDANTGDGP
ncbi:Serine/threonine protein kinase [Actinomadura meyerae]|uniref:Serine/threonine protein kinase n=1 Tax=Actinomadura meyerae TaxID=240840 RepID=A0A239NNL4_9ACTN|nr:PQQ-binding-like beta-propeller repeat protein [Actinomadura meyerae]SNT56476.1 Serine/threonine protein kinase [Actinomadura meyerae]